MGNIYDKFFNCNQEDERVDKLVKLIRKLYEELVKIHTKKEKVIIINDNLIYL